MKTTQQHLTRQTRINIGLVIFGLAISGITAFPLEYETQFLLRVSTHTPTALKEWLGAVAAALADTNTKYPFLSYGTDWLAFAHVMLAILFIGPFKNPIKNKWIIEFGIICSLSILPLALIAGHIREIPFFWQLVDCAFGLFAMIPLIIALKNIHQLEKLHIHETTI